MSDDRSPLDIAQDLGTPSQRPQTLWTLFSTFLKIGVLGFGGVAAFARHVIVIERGLLNEQEFAELFGVCSTLPGANTVNLATILGDRHKGAFGALAAVLGLVGVPLLILIGIASLYTQFSDLAAVRAGLSGAAAAAAGLVFGTSLKILKDLKPDMISILVVASVFIAAMLKLPMLFILAMVIPASLAIAVVRVKRRAPPMGPPA